MNLIGNLIGNSTQLTTLAPSIVFGYRENTTTFGNLCYRDLPYYHLDLLTRISHPF